MRRGRKKGVSIKTSAVGKVVDDYRKKHPNLEGLFEFYVPLNKKEPHEFDLIVIDRTKNEVVGVKACKVTDEVPPEEALEPTITRFCTELRLYRGSKCVFVTRKEPRGEEPQQDCELLKRIARLLKEEV